MNAHSFRIQDGPLAALELSSLPLTTFERSLVQEDCPDSPLTCFLQVDFSGEIQESSLKQAANIAADRHPLLKARIEASGDVANWVFEFGKAVTVERIAYDNPLVPREFEPFDLLREPGIRLFHASRGGRSRVWLHFHHACCDEVGGLRYLYDLLIGYARLTSRRAPIPVFDDLDYGRLESRSTFPRGTRTRHPGIVESIRHSLGLHFPGGSPLMPSKRVKRDGPAPLAPFSATHRFEVSETDSIRDGSQRLGQTINDVAASLLFRALANWNERGGFLNNGRGIRLLMPVDRRTPEDAQMPAANRMGFSLLTRRTGDCRNDDTLCRGIHDERVDLSDGYAGGRDGSVSSSVLSTSTPSPATAILSDLHHTIDRFSSRFPVENECLVVGDLRLDGIVGVPPIWPGTRVAFGLDIYAGRLSIGLRTDALHFDENGTRDLLATYVAEWERWLASRRSLRVDLPDAVAA